MKLTSFTTFSVVATCLSGSVWANEELLSTKCSEEFCSALIFKVSPEEYDKTIEPEVLNTFRTLAKSIVNTKEPEKTSPNDIAGAAKVFLLDKMYMENMMIDVSSVKKAFKQNGQEMLPYHYFIIENHDHFINFAELKNLQDVEGALEQSENPAFYQLSRANPVEAKAADFIVECDEWVMQKLARGVRVDGFQ
ncbi:hypothetical protein IWQ61_010141 [Dispira simplex]|nr:hypothetical protein IWQ61_010141 [Dispira simplex]